MNRNIIVLIFGFLLFCRLYAADMNQLQAYFENEQFDELGRAVRSAVKIAPANPDILFFLAYTSASPDSALPLYRRVAEKYPKSKFADQALYRLGQYYFFSGDYATARRYFARLLRNYPKSFLKDDAQYLYCQCILAHGKKDSAKIFLKAFVQNVRRSPYVDSAILDLENLGGIKPKPKIAMPAKPKTYYSIQVASFKSFESAKNALFKLAKIYPHVEVGDKQLGNTEYYVVYLGRFNSFDKAQHYARLYIEPQLQDYKIVQRGH